MHEREHKESALNQTFFCFKYRLMTSKEEPQTEKLTENLGLWKENEVPGFLS